MALYLLALLQKLQKQNLDGGIYLIMSKGKKR
jgi:hypothetical protein